MFSMPCFEPCSRFFSLNELTFRRMYIVCSCLSCTNNSLAKDTERNVLDWLRFVADRPHSPGFARPVAVLRVRETFFTQRLV